MSIAIKREVDSGRLHPFARLFVILMLIPAFFYIGPLLLDPHRLMLLLVTPVVLVGALSGKYGKVNTNDKLIILYFILYIIGFYKNNGNSVIAYIGINFLFIIGGYFVGRVSIRSVADLRRLSRLILITFIVMLPLAAYESLTTQFITPKIINAIPGVSSIHDVNYPKRLGLDRAQVVWLHPIHLGVYASLSFAIYFITHTNFHSLGKRIFGGFVIVAVCIFSVSSGPMTGLMLQIGLIVIWFATWKMKRFWRSFVIACAIVFLVLELASNRPLFFILADLVALNPWNAYVRLLIFQYGSENVMMNPFFGRGLNDWERPGWLGSSMDNHWLLIALQTGLPSLLCIAGMFVNFFVFIAKNYHDKENEWDQALFAVAVCLVGMLVALSTVAIWSTINSFGMFMLGAFGFMFSGRPETGETTARAAEPEDETPGLYLTGGPGRRRTVL